MGWVNTVKHLVMILISMVENNIGQNSTRARARARARVRGEI